MVILRSKARNQCGHSAHYRGLKLATSTFVLSILDVDLYIPQALRFDYNIKTKLSSVLRTKLSAVLSYIPYFQ